MIVIFKVIGVVVVMVIRLRRRFRREFRKSGRQVNCLDGRLINSLEISERRLWGWDDSGGGGGVRFWKN